MRSPCPTHQWGGSEALVARLLVAPCSSGASGGTTGQDIKPEVLLRGMYRRSGEPHQQVRAHIDTYQAQLSFSCHAQRSSAEQHGHMTDCILCASLERGSPMWREVPLPPRVVFAGCWQHPPHCCPGVNINTRWTPLGSAGECAPWFQMSQLLKPAASAAELAKQRTLQTFSVCDVCLPKCQQSLQLTGWLACCDS